MTKKTKKTLPPLPYDDSPNDPSEFIAQPYPSLAVMRQENRDLLREFREVGSTESFAGYVLDFVMRGSATGVLLDVEDDRWAAQNMIDYWATMLYRWGYEGFDSELNEYDYAYAPELSDEDCPYLGLNAFDEEQQDEFFGRDRLVRQALEGVENHRFAAVMGLAGSGKSSLVLAGLIPRLKGGVLPQGKHEATTADGVSADSGAWLYLPRMMPEENPLENLARILRPPQSDEQWLEQQIQQFMDDDRALLNHLNQLVSASDETNTTVLFVDEFEELFTMCHDDRLRERFMANLIAVITDPESVHVLIMAMSNEYEALCEQWPALWEKLKVATVRVTPPTTAELREVILKPAAQIGLKFDEGLVNQLLQDVSGEQTALPLLQFTLLRLWDHRDRNRITWDAYNRVGSGRASLITAVNEFYRQLSKQDRTVVKKLFLQFAIPHEESGFELQRVERRQLHRLADDPSRIDALLEQLLKTRLIRLNKAAEPENDEFDLVHAALAQDWAQYVEWLEEARAEQFELLRLRTAAQQWRDSGKELSRLRRGKLLESSMRFLRDPRVGALEHEFLNASIMEEERRRREQQLADEREKRLQAKLIDEQRKANARLRIFVTVLTFAAIIAILASILALTQRNQAVEDRAIANTAQAEAEEANVTVVAARGEALEQADIAATAVVEARINEQEARNQAAIAATAEAEARVSEREARDQAAIAATAEAEARDSAARALAQAQIARSGQLAAQAFGLRTESNDLSLLLALHALEIADTVEARSGLLTILQAVSQQTSLIRNLILEGHEERVFSASFSPDGKVIASGGQDEQVILWDVETGRQIGSGLRGHRAEVRRTVFSPEGDLLATVGYDRVTILWDVRDITNPRELSRFSGHEEEINALVFIPDSNPTPGRFLATASRDRTIAIWNIDDPANPLRVSTPQGGHVNSIYTMVVSPDGRQLITAGADQLIMFWDIGNPGRPTQPTRILAEHSAEVNALAISPDGRTLASGDDSGIIILWDMISGQRLDTLLGHSNWILELDFDESGRYLASGSRDGSILLWDMASRSRLSGPFTLHQNWVWDVEFNPEATQLVSAGREGRVILWDVDTNPGLEFAADELPLAVRSLSFPTADTVSLIAGDSALDWSVKTGSVQTPDELERLEVNEAQQATLQLSADGAWAAAFAGRTVYLWETAAGGGPLILGEHTGLVEDVAFSADGRQLASVSCARDEPLPAAPAADDAAADDDAAEATREPAVALEPCTDSEVRLWAVEGQQAAAEPLLVSEFELVSVAFSPDGNLLIGGGCLQPQFNAPQEQMAQDAGDKSICLLGAAVTWSRNAEGVFADEQRLTAGDDSFGQTDYVRALAVSPNGSILVTGSDDGTLMFWDVAAREPLSPPASAHSGQLNEVAFSPNGEILASVGNDALVVLWDVTSRQRLAAELEGHGSEVLSVAFSPSGGLLATGDTAGQLILWRANLDTWRSLACEIAGRNLTAVERTQYNIAETVPPVCPQFEQ